MLPKGRIDNREAKVSKTSSQFTGEVLTNFRMFNPTVKQIKEIKGLPEDMDFKERIYFTKGKEGKTPFTVLSLLCEFNPNDELGLEGEDRVYYDGTYVYYDILLKDEIPRSAKGKYQIIDESINSAWIEMKEGETVKDAILRAKNGASNYYIDMLDENSARVAKIGEVLLYELLLTMSSLMPHTKEYPLTEFKLGTNPQAEFSKICKGNVTFLNKQLMYETFKDTETKEANKLGLMLGVKENDEGKQYQSVYNSMFANTTFKERDYPRKLKEAGWTNAESRLNSKAISGLFGDYAWKDEWDGFVLAPYGVTPSASSDTSDGGGQSDGGTESESDDLPF